MKRFKAAKIWIDHHKTHSKKNRVSAYRAIFERFIQEFDDGPVKHAPLCPLFDTLEKCCPVKFRYRGYWAESDKRSDSYGPSDFSCR